MRKPLLPYADLRICLRQAAVLFDIVHDFIQFGERKTHITVCTAIVQSDLSAFRIMDRRTREAYVRNETSLFIPLFRCQQESLTSVKHFGRVVDIQDRAADAVYEAKMRMGMILCRNMHMIPVW